MGLKKHNPGCTCCEPCTCKSVIVSLVDYPSYYDITVAGLVDDFSCSSCASWNGDFRLCYNGITGLWQSPNSSLSACGHVLGEPLWKLERISASNHLLTAVGIGDRWEKTTSWTPWANNTLSLKTPVSTELQWPPCDNRCQAMHLLRQVRFVWDERKHPAAIYRTV